MNMSRIFLMASVLISGSLFSMEDHPADSQDTVVVSQGSAGGGTQPYDQALESATPVPADETDRLAYWQSLDESGYGAEIVALEDELLPVLRSPLLVWSGLMLVLQNDLPTEALRRVHLLAMTDPTGDVGTILAARSGSPCAFEARVEKAARVAVGVWNEHAVNTISQGVRSLSSLEMGGGALAEVDEGVDVVAACKQIAHGFWQRLGKSAWRALVADFRAQRGEVFARMRALAYRGK